jgi:hypothetical protein
VSARRAIALWLGLGCAGIAAATLPSACSGVDNSEIYTEPILVHGAQFIRGELPGTPMPPPDAAAPSPASPGPPVTAIDVSTPTIYSGEAGWELSGDVDQSASAIAIRLGELGTGYWVLPLGDPDPTLPGSLTFSALVDFNPTLTPGNQLLRTVAVTSAGVYGVQNDLELCIASRLPADPGAAYVNDLSPCSSTLNPPAAVFALTWDTDVDLDLHVITPTGLDVNPKEPLVNPVDGGGNPPKLDPRIDRDSIAWCVTDAWREEDLVFPTLPAAGSVFQIRANLFSACGLPSVTFTLTTYQATGTPGVNNHLVQTSQKSGVLTSIDADGDSSGVLIDLYQF